MSPEQIPVAPKSQAEQIVPDFIERRPNQPEQLLPYADIAVEIANEPNLEKQREASINFLEGVFCRC